MSSKVWSTIKEEVALRIEAEPSLEKFLTNLVLRQSSISKSAAAIIASKIRSDALSSDEINIFINDAFSRCNNIEVELEADLEFFKDNDPACQYYSTPLLFYKGFLALSASRDGRLISHHITSNHAIYHITSCDITHIKSHHVTSHTSHITPLCPPGLFIPLLPL